MTCISSKICSNCGWENQCGYPIGKKDEQNKIVFAGGPCLCGPVYCKNCGCDTLKVAKEWLEQFNTNNYKLIRTELWELGRPKQEPPEYII